MTSTSRSSGVLVMDLARRVGLFVLTAAIAALALAVVPGLVGGPRPVLVESGSMAPAVRAGDVVLISEPDLRVAPGSIVTFIADHGRGRVTHRVVSVDDAGRYRTRGDANPTDDSSPLTPDRIEGTATFVVPFIGRPVVWWTNRQWVPLGATLLVTLAAVGTVLLPPPRRRLRTEPTPDLAGSIAVAS